MHLRTTAGGGDTEATKGTGRGEAQAADSERGLPERPGEAERCSEEVGERQRGCAAPAQQDGGAPFR